MRNHLRKTLIGTVLFCATLVAAVPLHAGEVAKADLDILGLGLEVARTPVTTGTGVPAFVQTIFGGKSNAEAPAVPGLSALGELTGPGITTPITLHATPGMKFGIPALPENGEYTLGNIRLVGAEGEFLQQAVPSFATITVTDVLKTEVRVRQLTPEELRERGISIDLRNYEVYEYTVILGVDEERVEIPYPVIVDKRTHTIQPVTKENGFLLPPLSVKRPPRFTPPSFSSFELGPGGPDNGPGEKDPGGPAGPSIPAAIILPNGFGVLHQFFAVILQVSNSAPDDAQIRLDNITATISQPQQMRVSKVEPAVSLGQPVPIYDAKTGTTYLIAGAQGRAEWTLEALKAGTHNVDITVEATYQKPGQDDFRLRGRASTAIVVSDPRFQINFSHPDTVREDEEYTAYAFITNMSPQAQRVRLDMSEIPACNTGGAVDHICRVEGEGITELNMQPGEMVPVPYKLMSQITGHVFAGAGTANDEALSVSVKLHMGVSASGIPLSPATLVMPHYAKFLPSDFIAANMQLLGLGYSLATAPLNKHTAKFPRVIKTDVFQRAQEIARAGQRIFVTRASRDTNNLEENRDSFFHLALDLLGNIERIDHAAISPELSEWDELRRSEKAGRRAAAAMARQLEKQGLNNGRTPRQFVDDFVAATSHRSPFALAWVHGQEMAGKPRPYALSLESVSTSEEVDIAAEESTGWVRLMPYAELTRFDAGTERGEMALLGRWKDGLRVSLVPQGAAFTLHLVYPDTADGSLLRSEIQITNATPGQPLSIDLVRGARSLVINGGSHGTANAQQVSQTPLRVLGAAQDLHLNTSGRQVSLLFNRPIKPADVQKLRDQFALTIDVPKANYTITRKNAPNVPLQIPGAALQQDGRIVNVYFDKSLSRNANYLIAAENMVDLVTGVATTVRDVVPRIDNTAPGGILTGRVLLADNTALPNAEVVLDTWGGRHIEVTDENGRYMYEFVARDIDNGISGFYKMYAVANSRKTEVEGAVRLPGEVQTVNLVFLGRGVARGYVRYDDGTPVRDELVTVGSTLYNMHRTGLTDENGYFEIGDLAVGPLTFSVVDDDGRVAFAANAIRTAGEVVTQDLLVLRRVFPGLGKVRVVVLRSDTNERVPNAQVGVYTQGYTLMTGHSDSNGFIEFPRVPAGLISIISAHFGISRENVGIELDLRADQTLEQTIIIPVPPPSNTGYAALEGIVTRDDPSAPGDRTKDQIVAGAVITIGRLPAITANPDGSYHFPDLPVRASGADMLVFDPATGRKAIFEVPTLQASTTGRFSPRLSTTAPEGVATVRVRLTSATGAPVPGYRVFEPGFPPTNLTEVGNGVYELRGVQVPGKVAVVAVPKAGSAFGEQMAFGAGRVDFPGQIGIIDMRLPGEGTIVTRLELRQPQEACPTSQPCYAPAFGKVAIGYSVWDEVEQMTKVKTVVLEADPSTQLNTFRKVPALQRTAVYTDRHPAGFAGSEVTLAYDGDLRTVTLRMDTVGDVTGRVYAHDRQTPVAGAHVKLTNGRVIYGTEVTKADGTFRFPAVQASLSFRIIAEYTQDGIHRKGYVDGSTPASGGPVSNMTIVLREQSTIEGQVVDMSGNPVPLAHFWMQELVWPNTEYGRQGDPLQADINGRFILTNVFTGAFRITAVSSQVQEQRGHYQGVLRFEGDTSQLEVKVPIGAIGFGTVTAKIIDSLQAYVPIENSEVTLYRGREPFDFATTDDRGLVSFRDVPAEGTYRLRAYSKTVGRAGLSGDFAMTSGGSVHRDVVLDFLGKVAGRVTDPEAVPAAPAKGVAVQVEGSMLGESVAARATTDGDGKFSLLGVPEGPFKLFAYDYDSGRMAFGPDNLAISKVVQEYNDIQLQLEKTATLTVNVFLPTDSGAQGEPAPLVDVLVEARDYYREAQGNALKFPKMIPRYSYKLAVRELGGEYRELKASGSFPAGATAHTHNITLQSTGTVEVLVLDGSGAPVSDAQVQLHGKTFYTPADGLIRVSGIPFGWISTSAKKATSGASASGELRSRSVPLRLTLNLGLSATVTGLVEAEEGSGLPSAGTRIVASVSSRLLLGSMRLETFTDANGAYTFSAIPIGGTRISFIFYGPDDTTIGHEMTVSVPDGTSGTFTIPRIKIDATPPRVLSIDPAPNSTNVAPSSIVTVTFSEAVGASFINDGYFHLRSTATDARVNVTFQPSVRPDGTFQVKMIPPAPPAGQKYPLASNVLYRVSVLQGLQDTTGNAMRATVGSSFTTVNYTEPAVVRVDPSSEEALPSNATFRIKFNKAVDPTSIEEGYGGVLKLEKLSGRGGTPLDPPITLSRYADPADPTVLIAAPMGVAIEESSFYRLTVSGVRDTQTPPNTQKDAKVVDFFSFDTKKPIARIKSPVAPGEKLVSGVLYTAEVEVFDEGTEVPSIDVDSVDWFDGDGKYIKTVGTPPYSFAFTAPPTTVDTKFTLMVSANDLSLNRSPAPVPFTWDVIPNAAPTNVVVANTPASAYPTQKLTSGVTFSDEGVKVTVVLKVAGKKLDGTDFTQIIDSKSVQRTSSTAAWPAVSFTYALPLDLAAGAAKIVAEVTDVAKTGSGEAAIEVLNDTTQPEVLSFLPKAETRYTFPGTYVVEVKVRDAETGIKSLGLTVGGEAVTPAMTVDSATGIRTYKYTATVKAKNADTRVAIVATVTDQRDNVITSTSEVVYERVDDATVPQAAWITPLDTAAIPFGMSGWQATLRIQATDDKAVTGVSFVSDRFVTAPARLTAPKSGTTNVYEAKVTFKDFPAGTTPEPFVVTAVVEDADPTHNVELPITLYPIVLGSGNPPAISTTSSISSLTDDPYINKTLVVRGSGVRVTVLVPLAVKNLIVLDGATVSTFEETKLDLTIAEHLFVDADSKIDVSDKGYLGGKRTREDGALTNSSGIGRTLGGTTTGGATPSSSAAADGSHAGVGGEDPDTITNATYGSIASPVDFGAGGSATTSAGGNGGGAVLLRGATANTARFAIAGSVRADGGSGASRAGAGAGGSVNLEARALVTGPSTRISAKGGDDDANDNSSTGGGGGRIAVRAGERFDVADRERLLQVRGGRNGTNDGSTYVDGGAGTVFVAAPGSTNGELIVSAWDENYPSATGKVRGTALGGDLTFDAITIGPRALARFDAPYTVPDASSFNADATALVLSPTDLPQLTVTSTTPAAGAHVAQGTSIIAKYTAQSAAGVTRARVTVAAQPVPVWNGFGSTPTFVPEQTSTVALPSTATPGETTLKVMLTDRAGRVVESAPIAFTIVKNDGPVIDLFEVTPPDEIYAKGVIAVKAKATDDVSVSELKLTSSTGTVTSATAVKPTPNTMTRDFTVAVPSNTPSGTNVTLTLSATDGFAGRTPTTATATVKVKKDAAAPAVTIAKPLANAQLQEAANATFDIEVTAADAEVAVQSVTALFEGTTHTLAPVAGRTNVYAKTGVPIPDVDGTDPVAKTITVTVKDFEPNTTTESVTIYVKPLVDPDAPKVSWVCGSPNALYPPGYATTLSVLALPASVTNGVSKVEFTIDGGTPLAATSAGNNLWTLAYTVPSTATNGTTLSVRASATSTAGKTASLLGSVLVVTGTDISTTSTIEAGDAAWKDQSVIVRSGGTLTITGPHTLKHVVVLSGGKLIQKHLDIAKADLLTVDRLYVGCGGSIDVTGLGYAKNTSHAGAGVPDDASGGSHIGRGGLWRRAAGGVYGSIYRPLEAGGGGHQRHPSAPATAGAGGGVVRIAGTSSVAIDGSVKANGTGWTGAGGAGAGGAVWLATPGTLSGGGTVEATGGDGAASPDPSIGGGGGAIALEYATVSGSLLTNLNARGGKSTTSRHASAGTIYTKAADATLGNVVIDNKATTTNYSKTELPSLGRAVVSSVSGSTIALQGTRWLPGLTGHSVRVYSADGAVRGTYRIAAVNNDAGAKAVTGFADVKTQDAVAYDGYILHSETGINGRNFVAARYVNARWEYDDDATFTPFVPQSSDSVIASFRKSGAAIVELNRFTCPNATCASVNGLAVRELASGEIVPNAATGSNGSYAMDSGLHDDGELFLRPDSRYRGLVVSRGADAQLALESVDGTPVTVAAGDTVRGLYRFQNLTLAYAKVVTEDLVESVNPAVLDANSSLVSGNAAAPAIDGSAITIVPGLTGPVLTGAAGAATDSDQPVEVIARTSASAAVISPNWQRHAALLVGTRGGLSLQHPLTGRNVAADLPGASTIETITGSGFLSFSASQTNKEIAAGLAPADTTTNYAEPGTNAFKLMPTGVYEVWSNGANVNKNGTYTTATIFRLEKTPEAIRWFVNGTQVYERTASIPASLRADFSFQVADSGEIRAIEYGNTTANGGTRRATAAADGSFKLPVVAGAGERITVKVRDGHEYALESSETEITAGDDIGMQSVTFSANEITGGRTATGTATLRAAAGADGAMVTLASNNANATVPASVTVAAGQTSATFTITTKPVLEPVDATISASYSGVATSATLRLLKDATPPTIVITSPAANAQYNEGNTNKIAVQVTATDDDSGVASVAAALDGQSYPLVKNTAKGPNVWTGEVPAPYVDGTTPVEKVLTITATDNNSQAGTASVTVLIKPVVDGGVPTISWLCSSENAIYPVGYGARLRVNAKAPSTTNPLEKVEVRVTAPDGTSTVHAAPRLTGDTFEYILTIPDAADGSRYTVRAIAVVASGADAAVDGSFVVLKGASEIRTNTTISATDTTYDNKSVVVHEGVTLTMSGAHTFARFAVLHNAKVVHPAAAAAAYERVNITATDVYVACGGSIDATGRGYSGSSNHYGRTWPGTFTGGHRGSGGTHGGHGGDHANDNGDSWGRSSKNAHGNFTDPDTPGGAGSGYYYTSCATCDAGGGIVRITTTGSIAVDGKILANGVRENDSGGAGGSISLRAVTVSGVGEIRADGGATGQAGGAGGRVALRYQTLALPRVNITAAGGHNGAAHVRKGGAGTVYLHRLDAAGAKVSDELIADNNGATATYGATLATLGTGTVTSVSGNQLTLSTAVPEWVEGMYLELLDASGAVVNHYPIASRTPTTVTVNPADGATLDVAPGTAYRGSWRVDALTASRSGVLAVDSVVTSAVTSGTTGEYVGVKNLYADSAVFRGRIDAQNVKARNLALEGATLLQMGQSVDAQSVARLNVEVAETFTVDAASSIDATGRGFAGSSNHYGKTWPGTFTGSHRGAGGTHGGRGGDHDDYGHADKVVYGSVMDPSTPGAAGSGYYYGNCGWCEPGGGVVRVTAGTFTLAGKIVANGINNNGGGGGAGGSIRIIAGTISGTGEIQAIGAPNGHAAGSGGRIAIHSRSFGLDPFRVTAAGGTNGASERRRGGAGTIYMRTLDAAGNEVSDELIVDNAGVQAVVGTTLASLGNGTVVSVSGETLTLSNPVPMWIEGSSIELVDGTGAIIGRYEIVARTATSVTVRVPDGETLSVTPGVAYRGTWAIDAITVRRRGLLDGDGGFLTKTFTGGTVTEAMRMPELRAEEATLTGYFAVNQLSAKRLTLKGATVTQLGNSENSGSLKRLVVDVSESLTVDATSSIDASGGGFTGSSNHYGRTWPGTYTGSHRGAGGTHGGRGGDHDDLGLADTVVYGSIMNPDTPGGSGSGYYYGSCGTCESGGGILRITAPTITLDGKFLSNGVNTSGGGGGAGGSIRIDAGTISGTGEIRAGGALNGHAAGGGGRIAVYSRTFGLDPLRVTAAGGSNGASDRRRGGAGTVYLRNVDAAGKEVADELIVDNNGVASPVGTVIGSLGTGTVISVSGNTVTLSSPVPEWLEGSMIEFVDPNGVVMSTYEIVARTSTTVTLRVPAGQSLGVVPGTAYRGAWAIDTITVRRRGIVDGAGAFITKTINGGTATELLRLPEIRVDEATFTGYFATNQVTARRLTLKSATLMQIGTSVDASSLKRLVIDISDTLTVDAASRITASGGGFGGSSGHYGKTWPGTFTGSHRGAGGSHGGSGGDHDDLGHANKSTYGSLFDPDTPGAAGSGYYYSACGACETGGGIVRLKAKTVVLDGRIESNGINNEGGGGGAGGSIRIDAETLNGAGEIHADGAPNGHAAGGGGRVAVYYTQLGIDPSRITAAGGTNGSSTRRRGAAGTVFLKSAAQQYGALRIDNRGVTVTNPTNLPAIGARVADTVTNSSVQTANAGFLAPNHFRGTRVYLAGNTTLNWPIVANTADTLTLDTTASALSIAPGQSYFGLLRFDSIYIRHANVYTSDTVLPATRDEANGGLHVNDTRPVVTASKISVENAPTGDAVVGTDGAVTDPNAPVTVTVTNTRTKASVNGTATASGSFRIAVAAEAGDTFTLHATDTHGAALTSERIDVNGAIVETNRIASVTLRPDTVAAGTLVYGAVQLTHPARAAGVVVSLASSSSAASVPSSVRVAGGTAAVQFPIETSSVSAQTQAVITATVVESKSATLRIGTATSGLTGVTLSSSSVEGGTSVDATVSLGAPAPAGGALVTLSSTSPDVVVPPTLTIPEGQASETFTVTTAKVAVAARAVIAAAYGSSASATLDLTACAAMESVTAPASVPMKTSWVNDAAPTGSTVSGDATFVTAHAAAGTSSIYFPPPGSSAVRTFSFTGAAALAVAPTDTLVVYALINPCNPPRQISVKWVESSTVSYTASWGESRIDPTVAQYRAGSVPNGGQWARLEVLAKDAGIAAAKNLTGLTVRVDGGEAWIDSIGLGACTVPKQPKPDYVKYETVWFDDTLPAGAVSGCTAYTWDITQTASGSASVLIPSGPALHNSCFTHATEPFRLNEGDVLFVYALVDPCDPPREVMLQWADESNNWNRRVYWGEDLIDYGARHTAERAKMGNLPQFGEWVRLEVPASMLNLEGQSVRGMAFTLYGGRAWFDRAGKYSRVNVALNKPATQSSTYQNLADYAASSVNDGDLATLNHTNNDTNSWVQIDLGAVQAIQDIVVENRIDANSTRLRDYDIFVSESPFTSQDRTTTINQPGVFRYHYYGSVGAGAINFNIQRSARYVRLQLNPKDYLHVRELQVWAPAATAPVNAGAGSRASASSTYDASTLAMHAFDGKTTDRHTVGSSIFHTANNVHAWLETDLQSVQQISTIDIIRRPDPYDSTGPVYVLVSDVPFTSKDLAATLAQPGVSAYHYAVSWDRPIAVNRTGRYVRVQRSATTSSSFGFGEMRIWSHGKLLGALAKPADPTDTNATE